MLSENGKELNNIVDFCKEFILRYIEKLKELAKLKDDGILTEDEFQKKKEEILSNNSESEPVSKKTEATPPEKKGFFGRLLEDTTKNRLETVVKVFSPDQEALKEWKKYKRQYKNNKINITTLRKKAKEIQKKGLRLTKASIKKDLSVIATEREFKRQTKGRRIIMWDEVRDKKLNVSEQKEWREHILKELPLFLKKFKGQLFNFSELYEALGKTKIHGKSTILIPAVRPIFSDILKDFENKGEILSQGNYYYVDEDARLDIEKREKKEKEKEKERINNLKPSIIKLLKELGTKIPASDIDAHLKNKNVDEIKEFCEKMYHGGEISRTSNYRYFVLTKKESKPTKSKQVDIGKELKKFKDLLDQELITQDDYDAKKKELLGL